MFVAYSGACVVSVEACSQVAWILPSVDSTWVGSSGG
jgi:hypothetical protein